MFRGNKMYPSFVDLDESILYVWLANKRTVLKLPTVNLTWREIIFTLRNRPVMGALCRKDTKVYAYSMYESVYAS